jgi:hypothetical protein
MKDKIEKERKKLVDTITKAQNRLNWLNSNSETYFSYSAENDQIRDGIAERLFSEKIKVSVETNETKDAAEKVIQSFLNVQFNKKTSDIER